MNGNLFTEAMLLYPQTLRDEIQELREYRNNIHLYLHAYVDMADEKPTSYNRAVKALEKLELELLKYY